MTTPAMISLATSNIVLPGYPDPGCPACSLFCPSRSSSQVVAKFRQQPASQPGPPHAARHPHAAPAWPLASMPASLPAQTPCSNVAAFLRHQRTPPRSPRQTLPRQPADRTARSLSLSLSSALSFNLSTQPQPQPQLITRQPTEQLSWALALPARCQRCARPLRRSLYAATTFFGTSTNLFARLPCCSHRSATDRAKRSRAADVLPAALHIAACSGVGCTHTRCPRPR